MNLTLNAPDVIRPRGEHVFTVDVDNAPRGEKVWMNFAAVDEGILQLTKFKSPDSSVSPSMSEQAVIAWAVKV